MLGVWPLFEVKQLTASAKQSKRLVLQDGTILQLQLRFVPMQLGWFFTTITYGDFVLENVRICVSPNILYQYKNQIPFGIACFSKASREPTQQQDFSSGAAKLYILSEEEVSEYSDILSGKV
jgi:hypothetical protein